MKKRVFVLLVLFTLLFTLAGCSLFNGTAQDSIDNNQEGLESQEAYKIYRLAATSGYEGTYEEWLDSIRGENGTPIELVVQDNVLTQI